MTEVPHDPGEAAEALFAAWLVQIESGKDADFDTLLAEHPEEADALRHLHDEWRLFAPLLGRAVPGRIDGEASIVLAPLSGTGAEPGEAPSRELLDRLGIDIPQSGRYRFRSVLGRGGGGIVLKVWDAKLNRALAMKVVLGRDEARPSGDTPKVDSLTLTRFVDEARIASQLNHPGIVPVHELGTDETGRAFFTMKLVKGEDLSRIFEHVKTGHDGWNQTRALNVLLRVCESVAFAHEKGVIHRDLKPANVMVGRHGEVYVMDWGLARVLGEEDKKDVRIRPPAATSALLTVRSRPQRETPDSPLYTMNGDVVGTPAYMSPEQARGDLGRMGPHSDVYAVGAMLYHLLAGHMPYVPDGLRLNNYAVWQRVQEGPPRSIEELTRREPAELAAICEKAMAREVSERYGDMPEFARDLRAFLEGRVVGAYETGPWAETRKWVRRNRPLASSLAAGVLTLLLGLLVTLAFKHKADERAAKLEVVTLDAKRAQLEAEHQTEEAQRNAYMAAIVGANAARQLGEPANVRRLLDSAPEQLRNWEWGHLNALSDRSLVAIRGLGYLGYTDFEFSPDGRTLATSYTDDNHFHVWDAATGADLLSVPGEGPFAFSPDGMLIALTSHLNNRDTVQVISLESGLPVAQLPHHGDSVTAIAFSPHGTLLATASRDADARIWDTATWSVRTRLSGQTGPSFSPDGAYLATISADPDDHSARVWNSDTHEQLAVLHSPDCAIQSARFSPDSTRLVTTGDGLLRVWSLFPTKELCSANVDAEDARSAEYSLDGSLIIVRSWNRVHLYDSLQLLLWHPGYDLLACSLDASYVAATTATPHTIATRPIHLPPQPSHPHVLAHTSPIMQATFSSDAKKIATTSDDGTLHIWHTKTTTEPVCVSGRGGLSPDGLRIATAIDSSVRIWDTSLGGTIAHYDLLVPHFTNYASISEGITLGWSPLEVRLWDADTGVTSSTLFRGLTLGVSPSGRHVATRSSTRDGLLFWSMPPNAPPTNIDGEWFLAFSNDGRLAAVATRDHDVRIWDLVSNYELSRLEGHSRHINFAQFSQDKTAIITIAQDKTVRLWEVSSGAERTQLQLSSNKPPINAAYSPDAKLIVTASTAYGHARDMPDWRDYTARIWDATSGSEILTLEGHTEEVLSASFSPDGTRVVTASADRTARVWDVASGWELTRLEGHESPLELAVFSSDGMRIVTSDGVTTRVWDSVPYRQRFADNEALRHSRLVAERALDDALAKTSGLIAAAAWLRNHINDVLVRRAALDILFERSEAARVTVEEMRAQKSRQLWIRRLLGDKPWPSAAEAEQEVVAQLDGYPQDYQDTLCYFLAWNLINPDAPFPSEAMRALALAHIGDLDPTVMSWTLFWLGRFDEALIEMREAVAAASASGRDTRELSASLERLESEVAKLRYESGELRREALTEEKDRLERRILELARDPWVEAWIATEAGLRK